MRAFRYLFIVNPVAGNNKANKYKPILMDMLRKNNIKYDIKYTVKDGGANHILCNIEKLPYDVIVAVGGDGTVNEVINGLVGSNKIVGIIPCGTGNDLAKSLNVPLNPVEAFCLLLNGKYFSIDLGKAGNWYFTNVASIGLDADIADCANKLKKRLSGIKAYLLALIKVLLSYKSFEVTIENNGVTVTKEVMLMAVCNGRYYGGGMEIAPDASVLDGLLDVCIIDKMSKLKLLFLFPSVYKGNHKKYKEVKFYKTDKVLVKTQDKFLNVDGEIRKIDKDIEFTIDKEKIQIFMRE